MAVIKIMYLKRHVIFGDKIDIYIVLIDTDLITNPPVEENEIIELKK